MSVRRASSADLDWVLAIEGAHPTSAHWTRRQFEEELKSEASVFLVIPERGFLVARRYPPNLEVLDVAVAVQRKGTGRDLLKALGAEANGCEKITLEVSARNEGGLAFYAALGFAEVGRRPRFYPDGSDAVLMDRPIR
jgi:ribosomal-protein-alanine N-acetyltransferase